MKSGGALKSPTALSKKLVVAEAAEDDKDNDYPKDTVIIVAEKIVETTHISAS